MGEMVEDKRSGFMIDGFLISFPPEGDIIQEHEDGTMSVLVDIHKVEGSASKRIEQSELTPELEVKINAYINKMLEDAIELEKEKTNG
jgi:hypothetical protein